MFQFQQYLQSATNGPGSASHTSEVAAGRSDPMQGVRTSQTARRGTSRPSTAARTVSRLSEGEACVGNTGKDESTEGKALPVSLASASGNCQGPTPDDLLAELEKKLDEELHRVEVFVAAEKQKAIASSKVMSSPSKPDSTHKRTAEVSISQLWCLGGYLYFSKCEIDCTFSQHAFIELIRHILQ